MAREKKIVPYFPQTKYPREDYWKILYPHRHSMKLDDVLDMVAESRSNYIGEEHYNRYLAEGEKPKTYREAWMEDLNRNDIREDNWRDVNDRWNEKEPHRIVQRLLDRAYGASQQFMETNRLFKKEYAERSDLQTIYTQFFNCPYYLCDIHGNQICPNPGRYAIYNNDDAIERSKLNSLWIDRNRLAPDDFMVFHTVLSTRQAKIHIENERVSPYVEGDLVRLRDPYVGSSEYDPMWISRYEQAKNGTTIPGRDVPRIGLVMKFGNRANWRGTRGSRDVEVQWLGAENTVHIPENKLKWEERPKAGKK